MKQFTTIKVGYRSGTYGCIAEYFTTIFTNGKKHGSFIHYGLYGSEERINQAMKDKGYKEFHTPSRYGKMVQADTIGCISEGEAIKLIKAGLSLYN